MSDARLRGITLDCVDADELAAFYVALLGWEIVDRDPRGWVQVAGDADVHINVQAEARYVEPVWPDEPGEQQKMLHFEIQVDDLPAAIERAIAAGGRLADHRPPDRDPDRIRVMLDPAGHPLCLFVAGE